MTIAVIMTIITTMKSISIITIMRIMTTTIMSIITTMIMTIMSITMTMERAAPVAAMTMTTRDIIITIITQMRYLQAGVRKPSVNTAVKRLKRF